MEGEDYHLEDGYAVYEEDNMLRLLWRVLHQSSDHLAAAGYAQKTDMVWWKNVIESLKRICRRGFSLLIPEPVQEEIAQTHLLFAGENNRQSKLYRDLCSGDVEEVDQALQEFNQQLKAAGSDKVLTEANRQLEEWRRLQ